jgi:hypothetical protein
VLGVLPGDHLLTRHVEGQEGFVAVQQLSWCIDEVILLKCALESLKIAVNNLLCQCICSATFKTICCTKRQLWMSRTEVAPPGPVSSLKRSLVPEEKKESVLGIEWLLSMVTCIGFLNACTRQSHCPSPNPTTTEPCFLCLVFLPFTQSSGELLSRSSCRSQVSVPLISRPVPHYHWGGTTPT